MELVEELSCFVITSRSKTISLDLFINAINSNTAPTGTNMCSKDCLFLKHLLTYTVLYKQSAEWHKIPVFGV